MGGRTEFFGPVIQEPDEPVFHERWEGRVFGISNFLLPLLDWETFRKRLIANIAEDDARPYWQSWALALEDVLERGAVLARGELDDRHQELLSRPAGFDHHA